IARPGWRRRGEVARTGGISGLVYRGIRLVTRGTSGALRLLGQRRSLALTGARRETAVRAVVNGLIGDHLAETGNALAIPMVLRRGGQTLLLERAALAAALPDATGRVVLLIHGLCMSDLQWDPREIDGQGGQGGPWRPWPGAGARPGLHARLPALQHGSPHFPERPGARRSAGGAGGGVAGAGRAAGDRGPQPGRDGGAQRLPLRRAGRARLAGEAAQAGALGELQDPRRALAFPASHRWVAYGTSHLALLHRRDVYERIRGWLAD
ncbi:MAG TPA: hypothetical protein VEG34_15055, partial [Thermoanaerobaculia bacterium]|nr:hypothetical protein [Thermoanaerobaculia bacterium]